MPSASLGAWCCTVHEAAVDCMCSVLVRPGPPATKPKPCPLDAMRTTRRARAALGG
ncbi:hypothetical protein WOLCODRAFT_25846 [Wolfiporia cocos MD-104 SS10]|uniref:Uncharacterized protein n=1 Tax=Wolfiporia cocos (strain MD-104) TaxID=742152 RepID=A0A2H3JM81_WOLCO|nr:hypothetical protein WOLCODRAFT_25846 [Wolfiporia cocos MD-104 SS10]